MIARLPPNAPTGMPPPITLPSVVKSRRDAVEALRAARMHAKSRHHLVEDQHGAMAVAHRAQTRQELRARHDEIHVADDRLDDDARDALAAVAKRGLDRRQVVVREHDGFVGDGRAARLPRTACRT
jgi:hypothetical protein